MTAELDRYTTTPPAAAQLSQLEVDWKLANRLANTETP